MSMTTITVERVDKRPVTTKYGPRFSSTLVDVDGTKYNFGFDDPAKHGISNGSIVNGIVTSDKWGLKIDPKTVSVSSGPPVVSTAPPPTKEEAVMNVLRSSTSRDRVFPLPKTHGDTAIIRQNALTNAVSTVADYVATQPSENWPTLDKWTDMVIDVAYKYANFSSGQREMDSIAALGEAGVSDKEIETAKGSDE